MQRTVQTIILVIILLLQVIFLLIAWNNKTSITLANIIAILNLLLIASGFLIVYYFGLRQIKEELLLNKKMEIYEKLAKLGISFRNHFSFKLTVYMKFELEKKLNLHQKKMKKVQRQLKLEKNYSLSI